jgi:hypothetical protein
MKVKKRLNGSAASVLRLTLGLGLNPASAALLLNEYPIREAMLSIGHYG